MIEKIKAINPEIIVSGDVEKPYYQIRYYDTADNLYHIGYGSYKYSNVLGWLKEYFEVIEADERPIIHGYWDDSFDGITPFCSVCGSSHHTVVRMPKYCPNCGAKMNKNKQGEENED